MSTLVGLSHVRLIAEEDGFWDVYQDVVRHWPARGNQVPDAHLAALLRQHGVRSFWPIMNGRDDFPHLADHRPAIRIGRRGRQG